MSPGRRGWLSARPQLAPARGVVACVEQLAAEAGAQMLRRGGNAADAAIAAAFAQGVVDPIYCGIGGGFHGIFLDAMSGRVRVISADRAPAGVHEHIWADATPRKQGAIWRLPDEQNRLGYEAPLVPGFVRGAHAAFRSFGSGQVSWRELLAPAITLAIEGFRIYPYLYKIWMPDGYIESSDGPRILAQTPASRTIYLRGGDVLKIGDLLVQTDYGRTLMRIADQGPDEFYEGETAQLIAADFAAHGGFLTAEDLRDFRPDESDPVRGSFRGWTVLTEPPPTLGATTIQILNVIEPWDLKPLGWNTASYFDRLARAMYYGFRDRMTLVADPAYHSVPLEQLLSKAYAADLRALVEAEAIPERTVDQRSHPEETTHVSVMDTAGNAAAITHSLGIASGVVTAGLGFLYNSSMVAFDPRPGHPNSVGPNKRPITGGGPTLFVRDDEVFLTIGSPGGARKTTALIQALLAVTDFGASLQEAVSAPRIHVEDRPTTILVDDIFPAGLSNELAQRGFAIEPMKLGARLAAVMKDPLTGQLIGGSDPRGDGGLAAV